MCRSPGVYQDYHFPEPSVELDTGIPAFLGVCNDRKARGEEIPINQPQKLFSSEFEQFFRQPLSKSYLAYAVRGFFQNGGRSCYVVRLKNVTPEALGEGLAALESLNTIDLVCAPDIMRFPPQETDPEKVREMQFAILNHCSRLGDRFAILDALPRANLREVREQGEQLDRVTQACAYGALYYPWIGIADGSQQSAEFIPPCGHIAGVYARSDEIVGVRKAPANEILEGVLELEVNLTAAEQDELNPASVNCLRTFPGRGIRIWGARTLSSDPQWRYVNVKRLFLTVRRWLELNMSDTLFEPNNAKLWANIRRDLTAYLNDLFTRGALTGNSPSEAFYVKCDEETNPSEIRDAGRVVTELGLAAAIPGEFIVIRLVQSASGVAIANSSQTQPLQMTKP